MYSTCAATRLVKMLSLKKPSNRKGQGWTLNILPQVCHDKMDASNKFHSFLQWGMHQWQKFNAFPWNSLWAETASTTMLLKNNLLNPNRTLSPFHQFFGKGKRSILSSMQKFGEICVTTHRVSSYCAKLANRGTPGIWVGYADGHLTGTYRVFCPKIKKIIFTRDVTFLQKSYRH